MNLPKRYARAVVFAKQAEELELEPKDLAELCVLAERAARAQERECNGENYDASRAMEAFEAKAKPLGFAVEWPGLYPHIKWNGKEYLLPYMS